MSELVFCRDFTCKHLDPGDSCKLVDFLIDDDERLRKLVRWMYDRMDESCAVQHCYAPAPIDYDTLMQAHVRAYELGIEVDG